MIEHHVYFWMAGERLGEVERKAFEEGLAGLFRIDAVAGGTWGTPAPTPTRPVIDGTFHYALSLRFASVAEHDAYQTDPIHEEFVAKFKPWWEQIRIHDVEARES